MSYALGRNALAMSVTFITLHTATVAARFYVRVKRQQGLKLDDWLCIPAWLFTTGTNLIWIMGFVTKTIGGHSPPRSLEEYLTSEDPFQLFFDRLEFTIDLLLVAALVTMKLSILFLYHRMFKVDGPFRLIFRLTCAFTICSGLAFIIGQFAGCGNHFMDYFASIMTTRESCMDRSAFWVAATAVDVFTDLVILAMPIPQIFKLQMPIRRKIAVYCILLIASVAISCGIIRMVMLIKAFDPSVFWSPSIFGLSPTDLMGTLSVVIFWGSLEANIALIAICLPALRPHFTGNKLFGFMSIASWRGKSSMSQSETQTQSKGSGSVDRSQVDLERSIGVDGKLPNGLPFQNGVGVARTIN